ncbi:MULTISPECIES: DUF6400 family protein [Streptomyces]|uniref:DUF6400 family protein n=1 Tax=Streptomyces gibsoniae TaxID=3075529 RepID=A0ABU2U542_9ACTN|nr:DUF6400 family protein [Streptomyces sp. DSM 41699]MDT0468117.1 DUF6400 family protein [Streptomyces sp. DSM 41699]
MSPHDPTLPNEPDEPAAEGRPAVDRPDSASLGDFSVDLTSHEALRRTHVLAALGPDWDPVAVLRDEDKARDMLYSDLSEEQQRLYDELVAAGVLPRRGDGSAAS